MFLMQFSVTPSKTLNLNIGFFSRGEHNSLLQATKNKHIIFYKFWYFISVQLLNLFLHQPHLRNKSFNKVVHVYPVPQLNLGDILTVLEYVPL
jgi:hypothetical protein